jgi:hypothetical protein
MKSFIQRNWTFIMAGLMTLWGAWGPQMQAWIALHPKWTVAFGVATSIIAHLSPSPTSPKS